MGAARWQRVIGAGRTALPKPAVLSLPSSRMSPTCPMTAGTRWWSSMRRSKTSRSRVPRRSATHARPSRSAGATGPDGSAGPTRLKDSSQTTRDSRSRPEGRAVSTIARSRRPSRTSRTISSVASWTIETDRLGWARRTRSSRSHRSTAVSEAMAPTRSSRCAPVVAATARPASSTAARAARAWGSRARADGVGRTGRRVNRAVPSSRSRDRTCWLRPDWVRWTRRAARVKEPVSRIARKQARCLSSTCARLE